MAKIPYQLLATGPIRTEARRLAKETLKQSLRREGIDPKHLSEGQWENLITVALWNNGAHFLLAAELKLGERK